MVEARPREGHRFDFESRYEIGKTDFFCPADLPGDAAQRAQRLAEETYELLGCAGFARVDMILDGDEQLHVLEAQAIPGMTETSLLPQAAEAAGISFDRLVERLSTWRSRATRSGTPGFRGGVAGAGRSPRA